MFRLGGTAAAVLVNTNGRADVEPERGRRGVQRGPDAGATQYQALLYGAGTAATSMALSMVLETKAMARGCCRGRRCRRSCRTRITRCSAW